MGNTPDEQRWILHGPQGEIVRLPHRPRLVVDDMAALYRAVRAGVGCAVLPRLQCHDDLQRGDLQPLLPGWSAPTGQTQAAFASRRGMRPAVRQLCWTRWPTILRCWPTAAAACTGLQWLIGKPEARTMARRWRPLPAPLFTGRTHPSHTVKIQPHLAQARERMYIMPVRLDIIG
ncbi:MAG: LysR substrate-binding domain-containing protein [Lautropia sp.]|nr:LysR substrate-binding domain-containing protein [Lautropia sp.]